MELFLCFDKFDSVGLRVYALMVGQPPSIHRHVHEGACVKKEADCADVAWQSFFGRGTFVGAAGASLGSFHIRRRHIF